MRIAVISSKRASQVAIMNSALSSLPFTWYIPASEADEYRNAGARNIRAVDERGKSIQLNAALDDAFADNEILVTLDDDYRNTKRLVLVEGKKKAYPITLETGLRSLVSSLINSSYFLAGASPNLNPFYANETVKEYGHINGQVTAQKPSIVRYDPELKSKVDLEYSLAHHAQHCGVVKHNNLLFDFHMLGRSATLDKNYAGGLADVRTKETDAHSFAVISKRYGIEIDTQAERPQKRINWREVKFEEAPSWRR